MLTFLLKKSSNNTQKLASKSKVYRKDVRLTTEQWQFIEKHWLGCCNKSALVGKAVRYAQEQSKGKTPLIQNFQVNRQTLSSIEVTVRLDKKLVKFLEETAHQNHISYSGALRYFLQNYISRTSGV